MPTYDTAVQAAAYSGTYLHLPVQLRERLKTDEVVQHYTHGRAVVAAVHEARDVRIVEAAVAVNKLRQSLGV